MSATRTSIPAVCVARLVLALVREVLIVRRGAYTDTSIGSFSDSSKEVVIVWVPGHGEGRVDDAAVHLDTDVDLHDVTIL